MSDDAGGGASRSTDPAAGSSAATDVSLREFFAALREADLRLDDERDRRYTELAIEREKALKIKETADRAALGLAREIQTYKDEKANELRAQIESERGSYATQNDLRAAIEKIEATIKPLVEFTTIQQGRSQGVGLSANAVVVIVTLALAAISLYFVTH